jgi:hypothetical protein
MATKIPLHVANIPLSKHPNPARKVPRIIP